MVGGDRRTRTSSRPPSGRCSTGCGTGSITFGDLAFFDADGIRLYLHRHDEADWRPGSILYFLVEDIHAAQAALSEEGVSFTGAPHVIYTDDATGVEEWMTFFEDGEGNTLALMSRVEPLR